MKDLLLLLNGRNKSIPAAARFSFDQSHYSVNGAMQTFSDLFTTTRASKAWGVDNGEMIEYAVNEPMLSSKGLGVWEAATNELLKSNDFAAATTDWANGGDFTISAVTSIGDSLGLTAYKHTGNNIAFKQREQTAGVFSGSTEILYMIIENEDADFTRIGIFDSSASAFVGRMEFDWATGVASVTDSTVGSGVTAGAELLSASGPSGGAVYLLYLTGKANSAGNQRRVRLYPTGLAANNQAAIIHHVQLCELDYVHPPILTDATTVTKNADVIVNNAAISSWYNQSEGTFLMELNSSSTAGNVRALEINDGVDFQNSHILHWPDMAAGTFDGETWSGGIDRGSISTTDTTLRDGFKVAYAYALNDTEMVIGGASEGVDSTVAPLPTGINTLSLGSKPTALLMLNGYIQNLRYYNTRLTQAQLEAITS